MPLEMKRCVNAMLPREESTIIGTDDLRHNESRYKAPFCTTNGFCPPNTVGSGQAKLDTTTPSVQRRSGVSLSTPKAFVTSKFTCTYKRP